MKNFNLTPRVKKALEQAQELAKSLGHERINCAHIFKTVMELDYPMFRTIFRPFMINQYELAEKIIPFVEQNHPEFFKKKTNQKTWHNEIEEILKFANETSLNLKQEYIGVEHVLYALVMTSPTIRGFLEYGKFPISDFAELLMSHLDPNAVKKKVETVPEVYEEASDKLTYIKKYCTNLTELALNNKLNNIYGRETEISLLVQHDYFLSSEIEDDKEETFEYGKDGKVQNDNLLNYYKFQSKEELDNFIFIDYPIEIFGHAGISYNTAITDLNKLIYENKEHNFTIIGLDELGKAKPATLFFLSKNGFMGNNIKFTMSSEINDLWKKCDLWISDEKRIIDSCPKNKKVVKFNTDYNQYFTNTLEINKLTEINKEWLKYSEKTIISTLMGLLRNVKQVTQ
jgi:hypothetical protein